MNRRRLLASGAALIMGASGGLALARSRRGADARPNFLIIMADDLGYSDIGAYGGEIDTPNLDALARRSIRLNNFYNLSRCCPSRAALLTGRYPHRVGVPGNGTSLSLEAPTVAEELRDAGYATSMIGKWHLTEAVEMEDKAEHLKWLNHQGHFDRDFGDRRTYPAARGFQHHWGLVWGVADFYDPFSLVDDFTPVREVPKDFYLTDALSDRAAQQVRTLGAADAPFMMYLAYTAPHWPLHAPEAVIQKYLPRYAEGWDKMRAARYARQVRLGLIDPKLVPPSPVSKGYADNADPAWDALTAEQREVQVRKMATHAAMIDVMDQGIGRVVQALKDSGAYENTVIMFLSDNGASPEVMVAPGYDRPSETRDGRKIQYGEYQQDIGSETTMAGIGTQWASAANTPWRYWKREQYEGGTRTSFMISWPGHMGEREGKLVDRTASVVDVTPTLLELAGQAPRPVANLPMDGVSFAGVFQGKPGPQDRPLFFEHVGARGVLHGDWKLVSLAKGGPRSQVYGTWALYNLRADPVELNDLSARHPEQVARLAAEWGAWAKEVGVPMRREPQAA